MKFSDYIDDLSIKVSSDMIAAPDHQIFSIYIYPESSANINDSSIYVYDARSIQLGKSSTLRWSLPGPDDGIFNLCIITSPGSPLDPPDFNAERLNLIMLESDDPFSELFNALAIPFTEVIYYEDRIYQLTEAVRTSGDKLPMLIETAGSVLTNPLLLISTDGMVIHSYIPENEQIDTTTSRLLNDMIEVGMLTDIEISQKYRKTGLDNILLYETSIAGHLSYTTPVFVRGIRVASIICITAVKSMSRSDRRLLRRCAQLVHDIYFQNESLVTNSEIHLSGYLTGLLHNQSISDVALENFINKMNLKTADHCFYILIIRPCREYVDVQDLFNVISNFRDLLNGRPFVTDGPNLVVLLNHPTSQLIFDDPLLISLRERAESLGQIIGTSQMFYDLKDVPKAYSNAITAAQIGTEINLSGNPARVSDKTVFFFWQIIPMAMVRELISFTDVKKYIDPVVLSLREYDADHNTDYTFSLYCYLSSNNNFSVAAERANVHKNTIVYRIRRIEEMYGISLSDHHNCFRLNLSFVILMTLQDYDLAF